MFPALEPKAKGLGVVSRDRGVSDRHILYVLLRSRLSSREVTSKHTVTHVRSMWGQGSRCQVSPEEDREDSGKRGYCARS